MIFNNLMKCFEHHNQNTGICAYFYIEKHLKSKLFIYILANQEMKLTEGVKQAIFSH